MLRNTEAEVAGLGEVALAELVLLDLKATLENLLSLGTADGDVDSDLLVTADTKSADGVAGLACGRMSMPDSPQPDFPFPILAGIAEFAVSRTVDRSLTAQLLEHLGGSGKSVTRLANGDVENELLDAQLTHRVARLVLAGNSLAVGLLV